MKQNLQDWVKGDKVYLSIVLSLSCCLFILGYQYVHRLNRMEEAPPVKEETKAVFPKAARYSPGDTLLDIKLNRDRERSRDLERIQGMLNQTGLSDEIRKEAEKELWRLSQASSKENEVENMLKANGFQNCLVTIGQKVVTVVISGRLRPEEAKAVGEVISEVTGMNLEQVRIVEQL